MIDTKVTTNKGVENAEKNLEQARHRLATERKLTMLVGELRTVTSI